MADQPASPEWLPPAALDPGRLPETDIHRELPTEIPYSVRRFGCLPSLDRLRVGDLLLISETRPSMVARAIFQTQLRAGFSERDARWIHAAVYLGNELICEASRKGVRTSKIFKYCVGGHYLRFRRDHQMSPLDSCKVALGAVLKLHYRYNFLSIGQLFLQAHGGIGWRDHREGPRRLSARATICSQLYADAYGLVSRKTLDPTPGEITPAHLASNRHLSDIPMTWLKIPK